MTRPTGGCRVVCITGVLLLLCLIGAIALAMDVPRGAADVAAPWHKLNLYSIATHEQFINNNDDEARGDVNNPFGTISPNAASVVEKHYNGPFPGDEALFAFNLYTSASLKTMAGTAIYTCQYYFNKSAFCDASFALNNGALMIGAGTFGLNATTFALAVTGGYGKDGEVTGDVEASPSAHHAEDLLFTLH